MGKDAVIVAVIGVPLCAVAVFVGHAGMWFAAGILVGGWAAIMGMRSGRHG